MTGKTFMRIKGCRSDILKYIPYMPLQVIYFARLRISNSKHSSCSL